jgi:hypothetical protein
MYKLVFDTAMKTVTVFQDELNSFSFDDVTTVKPEQNFYEIVQKDPNDGKPKPVLRLPISSTLMIIKH